MCDILTRWGEAGKIESRETTSVLRGLRQHWTARWAPPNCFISDGEGALDSHEARVWAEKIGTQLVIRPTGGIGAATVERHNEILRQSLHRLEETFTTEGIAFVPEDVIAEALMAKNCLLNIHGVSPYQAVTGRAPRILRDFEAPGATEAGGAR